MTERPNALPYIRELEKYGDLTVWLVDGQWVRDNQDEEFTNFGHHYSFAFIPERELWLDREAGADEQAYFVAHMLTEYRLMAKGVMYPDALDQADHVERRMRRRAGLATISRKGGLPDPEQAHLELFGHTEDGAAIWLVDGTLVRSVFDIDWTEGGHEFVYEFIRPGEVWIDNAVEDDEQPFILLHELFERQRMMRGERYLPAHAEASRKEWECRQDPAKLGQELQRAGWF